MTLARARAAVDGAQQDPRWAVAEARAVLDGDVGPDAAATAWWASGLGHRELNDLDVALEELTRAVDLATAAGATLIAAGARTSRALVLTYLGDPRAGLAELDRAEPVLTGSDRSRAQMQRALILQRLGRLDEAIVGYRTALPGLVAADDTVAQVRLLTNLGIALTYRNALAEAATHLTRARELAEVLGQSMQVAACAHNLGFLHGRRGDIPAALTWFDLAADEYAAIGDPGAAAVLLADRTDVLLDAGLVDEAAQCSAAALQLLGETANVVELAEARLAAARAAQAAGRHRQARELAARAGQELAAQGRSAWSALAAYLEATSADAESRLGAADVDRLSVVAGELAAVGWVTEELAIRTILGRLLVDAGDRQGAVAQLGRAAAARRSGTAGARVAGWYAEALRRQVAGNPAGAARAAASGLQVIHDYRATLTAADLRAHAARHGAQLAELLADHALRAGGGRRALVAAELWRSTTWNIPVRPPADPQLATLLSELRSVTADRRGDASLDSGVARVERRIRDHVRHQPLRTRGTGTAVRVQPAQILGRLGDRMLVEWLVHRGRLVVISAADGRCRVQRLGPVSELSTPLEMLRSCVFRMARGLGTPGTLAAASRTLAVAADRVGELLFGPIAGAAAERELVLVPTGVLHRIPWSALPLVRTAPAVVASSARAWAAADATPRPTGRLLVVAGRGAAAADREVAAITAAVPRAAVLSGADATVAAVLAALPGAATAHLAAHGQFRSDNPLLSSLALADGDLTAYDLHTVTRVPPTVILAACDAAVSQVAVGDELLGLAAALIEAGSAAVLAPSVGVPDEPTAVLMADVHRELATGEPLAAAWWRASAGVDPSDPRAYAAAAAFFTVGS